MSRDESIAYQQLNGYCGHKTAEENDADGLDTRTTLKK